MRQLQSVMSSLGLSQDAAQAAPAAQSAPASGGGGPDLSALAGMLGSLAGGGSAPQDHPSQNSTSALGSPDTLALVTRLAPLLSQVNREDDSTRLLQALRPLLSGARQQKIDEAVKILQLMRLLPLLGSAGLGK